MSYIEPESIDGEIVSGVACSRSWFLIFFLACFFLFFLKLFFFLGGKRFYFLSFLNLIFFLGRKHVFLKCFFNKFLPLYIFLTSQKILMDFDVIALIFWDVHKGCKNGILNGLFFINMMYFESLKLKKKLEDAELCCICDGREGVGCEGVIERHSEYPLWLYIHP